MTVCQKCGTLAITTIFLGVVCACPTRLGTNKENPDHRPLKAMQGFANTVGVTATTGLINFSPPDKAPSFVNIDHFMADRLVPSSSPSEEG